MNLSIIVMMIIRVFGIAALPQTLFAEDNDVNKGRRSTYRYYGVTFKKDKVIFINVKGSPSLKHIRTTIVHELVYYRFPYMEHGPAFHKPVEKIVRGKKFGPYKPKQNQKQRRR